jgi:hypothetical protein
MNEKSTVYQDLWVGSMLWPIRILRHFAAKAATALW